MPEDAKLDFYLKHRTQIEEWAALRTHAQAVLDQSLLTAAQEMAADGEAPTLQIVAEKQNRWIRLRIPQAEPKQAWIELNWTPTSLLMDSGGGAWPALIVCASPDAGFRPTRQRIKEATRPFRATHGLNEETSGWWVWYGRLRPAQEPINIDDYVQHCIDRFRNAWIDIHDAMRTAIQEEPHRAELE